ncbi:MAG: hypothetical protein RL346_1757 [Verrucomicrobiota bacterium]|jgi:LysM repeat protein
MKTKFFHLSLFLTVALVTPIHSASEVERLRALNAQQAKRIMELEQKIAQLTNTAPEVPQAEATHSEPDTGSSYIVREGDNLLRIARNHGTTTDALNRLNGLKPDAIIRPGQTLKVPQNSSVTNSTSAKTATPTQTNSIKHKVAEKETLSGIARKYEVSADSLIKANPNINPNVLRIGQTLQIPESPKTSASIPPAPTSLTPPSTNSASKAPTSVDPSKPIKITEKMTFEEFAKKHNTTTDRINELNNLRLDPSSNLAKGSEFYVNPP